MIVLSKGSRVINIIIIYTKNPTAPAGNRNQGLRIYVSVLWKLSYWDTAMTARNFHIYWIGSRIFRVYNYDRIQILSSNIYKCCLKASCIHESYITQLLEEVAFRVFTRHPTRALPTQLSTFWSFLEFLTLNFFKKLMTFSNPTNYQIITVTNLDVRDMNCLILYWNVYHEHVHILATREQTIFITIGG